MFESLNPSVIGYILNVVGLFFLASAITFKGFRRQIEEILGVERQRSLSAVRAHLVNQVQVYIGFVFLVAGYVLLMGHALQPAREELGDRASLPWVVGLLVLITLATMAVLKLIQLLYTRHSFRRLLGEVVRESGFNLEKNQKIAVEIGELLGIPKLKDQAVPEYIEDVRRVLGLEAGDGQSVTRRSRRIPGMTERPRVPEKNRA